MGKAFKYTFRGILILAIVLAAIAFWKREQITRLLAVNSLFSQEKIINNFSHMDTMFLTRALKRGDEDASPIPIGTAAIPPEAVEDWIKARSITSLVVLKDGKIVAENYFLDTKADDLRISWSVAKSFLSALFGIVMAEGEFMARGIYGQYIYVNRPMGVVIATTAADRKFREPGVADQNVAIFRLIAGQI